MDRFFDNYIMTPMQRIVADFIRPKGDRDPLGVKEARSILDTAYGWLDGVMTVAVTAGASAPEVLVEDVVNYLRLNGYTNVEEVEVMPENVRFGLPPEIVQAIGGANGGEAVALR